MATIQLRQIAYARSGDKGRSANVGLIARSENGYRWMREHVTAEAVAAHFGLSGGADAVERYEWEAIGAINFVLRSVLSGGMEQSLRVDAQGKALGQALLEMEVETTDQEIAELSDGK